MGEHSFIEPGWGICGINFEQMPENIRTKFTESLDYLLTFLHANQPDSGTFFSDNLLTFSKTLSFLQDEQFAKVANRLSLVDEQARQLIWRTHTLCWAAKNCLQLPGDFVELGCYQGTTAQFIYDYLEFNQYNKRYYLYDAFEAPPSPELQAHSTELYSKVMERFKSYHNMTITKGYVPQTFEIAVPESVAFMHIDMNNVDAEISALEILFPIVTPGGIIILDDYGWLPFKEQYIAEKNYMASLGYEILEMPTGQGMIIKDTEIKELKA